MKKNFKEQFENLRIIIKTNVTTLQSLLRQSEQLSEIIQTLNNSACDPAMTQQLRELRNGISASIETLYEQTQKLFKTYDSLIEEVFGKQ